MLRQRAQRSATSVDVTARKLAIEARRSELAALASGAVLTAAFAPFGIFPLAVLTPAALLVLWQDTTAKRAAWLGFLFGLGHYGCGIYWVTISLHSYGHAPLAFAVLATLLLVLYLALYPALAGYLLNRLAPRRGVVRLLLVAPALWVLLEWLRSWLLSGFPWLTLGYSQTDSPLAGLAPYLGVLGISWALLVSAGLLLVAVGGRWQKGVLPMAAVAVLWSGAYGLGRVEWTEPVDEPLRVSLIQGNIEQDKKFLAAEREKTLLLYGELSLQAGNDSDVIIWPETAIPVFFDELDASFVAALRAHARSSQTDYIAGVPAGDLPGRVFYNGVVSLGRSHGFYYKRKLLPFGEFLPLRWLFNVFHSLVDIPMADFTAGAEQQTLLTAGGQPVGISICFEAVFGDEIRRALPAASWLVNLSNDGWFGRSLAPYQHLQKARMRSIESERPMARATNTGISALIDHRGNVIEQGPQFAVATVNGTIQPRQGATPYVDWGDGPVLLLLGLLLAGGLAGASTQRLQSS